MKPLRLTTSRSSNTMVKKGQGGMRERQLEKSGATSPKNEGTPFDSRRSIEVDMGDRPMSRVKADLSTDGVLGNAALVGQFTADRFPDYDLTQTTFSLQALIKKSNQGDTGLADTLLIAQASSLNSVYLECMRRAAVNMQREYLEAAETYARLGLKAQAQCRVTLETLSKIKNPPNIAFVNQANIANGPQQVNNGTTPAKTSPRPRDLETAPIELMGNHNGKWVDY